jgi:predicted DNA-binding protein (MmcQ/YjbR family)
MSLHDRKRFAKFAGALPGAALHEQWESLVAKVGGKVFVLRGETTSVLVFKVSDIAFDGLVELPGIEQAAYFAKRQWVRVEPDALSDQLLQGYIEQSYRTIAAKLTRKQRAELGL